MRVQDADDLRSSALGEPAEAGVVDVRKVGTVQSVAPLDYQADDVRTVGVEFASEVMGRAWVVDDRARTDGLNDLCSAVGSDFEVLRSLAANDPWRIPVIATRTPCRRARRCPGQEPYLVESRVTANVSRCAPRPLSDRRLCPVLVESDVVSLLGNSRVFRHLPIAKLQLLGQQLGTTSVRLVSAGEPRRALAHNPHRDPNP